VRRPTNVAEERRLDRDHEPAAHLLEAVDDAAVHNSQALTLLPAVLALLGDRINALRIPFFGPGADRAGGEGRLWGAVVRAVMRRPVARLENRGRWPWRARSRRPARLRRDASCRT
jgi:hypothetical protein